MPFVYAGSVDLDKGYDQFQEKRLKANHLHLHLIVCICFPWTRYAVQGLTCPGNLSLEPPTYFKTFSANGTSYGIFVLV